MNMRAFCLHCRQIVELDYREDTPEPCCPLCCEHATLIKGADAIKLAAAHAEEMRELAMASAKELRELTARVKALEGRG